LGRGKGGEKDLTEAKERAGMKAGKGEREKSVEQLTDEKLTGVAGGIIRRQDRPCQPEQCAPPPPTPSPRDGRR